MLQTVPPNTFTKLHSIIVIIITIVINLLHWWIFPRINVPAISFNLLLLFYFRGKSQITPRNFIQLSTGSYLQHINTGTHAKRVSKITFLWRKWRICVGIRKDASYYAAVVAILWHTVERSQQHCGLKWKQKQQKQGGVKLTERTRDLTLTFQTSKESSKANSYSDYPVEGQWWWWWWWRGCVPYAHFLCFNTFIRWRGSQK